ncbi:aryl hydrocarbon receptor nuclear translocator 2-like [Carassius auratus]|uniref:Aryl hydrocarbon receptor nuclear translocator 2-like n=1 Tax=Carassius auratus TaxID=7957 RepID=A0A6P6NBW2_CARAU|nr:aryl hydrocarbon receptor nuclear translocator 2-like [Carassius auratus]
MNIHAQQSQACTVQFCAVRSFLVTMTNTNRPVAAPGIWPRFLRDPSRSETSPATRYRHMISHAEMKALWRSCNCRQLQQQQQAELEVHQRDGLTAYDLSQVPVASVPAGVHEAGKTIDKTDSLFSQERDPRFSDMYSGIPGSDKKMMVPSSTAGGQQLYSQGSPFQPGHSGKSFSSSVIHVPGVNDIQSTAGSAGQNLTQISRQINAGQVSWTGSRPPFSSQQIPAQSNKAQSSPFGIGSSHSYQADPSSYSPLSSPATSSPSGNAYSNLANRSNAFDVSGEGGQSGGQFQGRPSEVWSQWQSQHHSQQGGDQHPHPQSSQSEVFQVNSLSDTSISTCVQYTGDVC